jgi:probable F420-dependent oxidoreductase
MNVRIGAKLANFGPDATALVDAAAGLEAAGVDSLWLSDRVVTIEPLESVYPFTDDGSVPWTDGTPFIEALVAMAVATAHTSRVEVGTGVLVAPLRHPVLLAKQLASIDVLAGGRVVLGIGSGWMAEEYDLLGVPFAERAGRTDEAVELLRACWQGAVPATCGHHYRIPDGVVCRPAPPRDIPLLAGGMSPAALRRAGRLDGWFGYMSADGLDIDAVVAAVAEVRAAAERAGRAGAGRRDTLRVVGPPRVTARSVPALVAAGITEVVADIDWRKPEQAKADVAMLREAASQEPVAAGRAGGRR